MRKMYVDAEEVSKDWGGSKPFASCMYILLKKSAKIGEVQNPKHTK